MVAYRKKDGKFRLYTTFTDEYYTDWITSEEALKIIIAEKKLDFKNEIAALKKEFPFGYRDPKNGKMFYYSK